MPYPYDDETGRGQEFQKADRCQFCENGFLYARFGRDIECVNGILIDIDVANEGWQHDVEYPVAPCHPMWSRQMAGDDFPNDCQERLNSWAQIGGSSVIRDDNTISERPWLGWVLLGAALVAVVLVGAVAYAVGV